VAHTLSANKRIRQSAKLRLRNRDRKAAIRKQVKKLDSLIIAKDTAGAETELRKAMQLLDRVADHKTIHANTAARRKSRLAKKINALKAGAKA
jgi:small subunit ribosomal protein S20